MATMEQKAPALGAKTATIYKNFIGGEWVESHTGRTFENLNPADTRDVVGVFQRSDAEDVNRAIRKHLGASGLDIVVVAKNCEELKRKFIEGAPSPMIYNSPKPAEVMAEDKIVERWKIDVGADAVRIVPVEKVFE